MISGHPRAGAQAGTAWVTLGQPSPSSASRPAGPAPAAQGLALDGATLAHERPRGPLADQHGSKGS